MSVDDREQAAKLMQALEAALPLQVFVSASVQRVLEKSGLNVDVDVPVVVDRVFYGGDEAGICCGFYPEGGQATPAVVSITQLRPMEDDPLAMEIVAYQVRRMAGIARQNQRGLPRRSTPKRKRKGKRK